MRIVLLGFLLLNVASPSDGLAPVMPKQAQTLSRRAFCASLATAAAVASIVPPSWAMPSVTTDEFSLILRDSVRSIDRVEFSGPKSETVVVKLVDGTTFGLSDVVESPTDPRSPYKIAAMCRENAVPTKFVDLEAALAATSRRKKVYANERVLQAAEKEKEKKARMQRDEEERLAELARME